MTPQRLTPWQRGCRALLLRSLAGLETGRLTLADADGVRTLGPGGVDAPHARLEVADGAFYPAAVLEQSAGVGRAFMAGWCRSEDTVALVRLLARNEAALRRWTAPAFGLLAPWQRWRLWRRRNTRARARLNIAAHYDLGNDFFGSFLDETRTYSSAVFAHAGEDLAAAQTRKLDLICRKLDLRPEHHVLEIGTGWGSFALHAAGRYGCRVTTTTLSAAQAALARERVAAAGLDDRVRVLEKDYRELDGGYDRLASIEMIEAVGARYFPVFFRRCAELLRPDGAMALQAIVVDDRHYAHDARHEDFIKRWIFPGGVLPSVSEMARHVARETDLQLVHLEDFTAHYAETLARWERRLAGAWDDLRAAGRSEEFLRGWRFYFQYCRGGFLERRVGVVQAVLAKRACAGLSLLGLVDAESTAPAPVAEACRA